MLYYDLKTFNKLNTIKKVEYTILITELSFSVSSKFVFLKINLITINLLSF